MNRIIHFAKAFPTRTGTVFLLGLLLSACGRDDAQSYRVPKEPVAMAPAELPAGHPEISAGASGATPAAAPELAWTLPAGWQAAGASKISLATFNIASADGKQAQVMVTPLRGLAGKEVLIVNMWRQQVGQPELSADEVTQQLKPVEIGGTPGKMFEIEGQADGTNSPMHIVTAMTHRADTSWFFKLAGDAAVVEAQKPAFVAFLKSIKFEAREVPASLPAGHPEISPAPVAAAPAGEGNPKWEVPAGWKEIPGGQFLVAKFTLTGDGGAQAAVNVSMSAGDGGGLAANVNRWRGQLGQSPWTEAELQKLAKEIPVATGTATFIELSGTDGRTGQPASLVGAMVVQSGQAWFYKLMGDAKVVESQKAAFTKFVQTVKY